MSNRILNLGPIPTREPEPKPASANEFSPATADLYETQSDMRRLRTRIEQQENEREAHQRRIKALSIVLAVLIVCLAASAWFAYPTWKEEKTAIAGMVGLQNVASTLGERMNAAEANLNKMTGGLPALSARMDQLQSGMKANLQIARSQAQTIANQVGQRIREDVNQSLERIQSRLSGVESNQKEAAEHVNQLQEQVAGLQRELAAVRQQTSAATEKIQQQLDDAQQTSNRDLSGLNERIVGNQGALNTLNKRLDREKVEFQAPNRKSTEIAPGISLNVSHTNARRQEVDATLQLGGDRAVTIRGQGIQKPSTFYMSNENRPVELVFTEISKTGVSGYLIMPQVGN